MWGSSRASRTPTTTGGTSSSTSTSTPLFYVTPAAVEAFHDRFQNVDLRLIPSFGVGYRVIKTRKVECDLELAGGYQFTWYRPASEEDVEDDGTATVIPSVRIEMDDIIKQLDVDGLYTAQVSLPETENTIHHGELILSLELTKRLDLDVAFFWDRVESPVSEEDGTVPLKDDFRLTIGLGWEF